MQSPEGKCKSHAMGKDEPIAITGIGCRFPGGANGPEAFWQLLRNGVDAITEIPPDRWNIPAYYDAEPGLPGQTNSRWGGFIEGIDQFDPAFFGISPREAALMDPQQRLLLETAWESLEDAGFVPDPVAGSPTGVFVGISTFDYWRIQASYRDKTSIATHSTTGTVPSIAANRISYLFNLHGPSLAVDTACSSSLVAVHLACRSLRQGECSTALAGGVNAILIPDTFIGFSQMSMLSPDGRCRAFDARGNGFVRSEGAGVIVLKPLSAARADGDRIYAVIRGSAVNQDGRTSSLTVPGFDSQKDLIREACRDANVDPAGIDYVEAHGTGTAVGDPIEAAAIGAVLSGNRRRPCVIGSVKTNIGHLEAGSGIAGIIKTALVLDRGEVPPNLHFEEPNPAIDFKKWKLRVPVAVEKLPREEAVAAINSFGFGGTNAHVILQGVPRASPPPASKAGGPDLFVLSARDVDGLRALASQYAAWLDTADESLENVCHTLESRRGHHPHRIAIAAVSKAEVSEKLQAFLAGEARPGLSFGVAKSPQKAVFVFSGQGPQWWGMGRELLATHRAFREKIQECDALFRQWGRWSLLEEMSRDEATSRMNLPSIAQPAIFALQVALAAWWRENGVEPAAVIGHSVGEAAAAHLSGALDLPSAARVIFERGRCMELVPPTGKMLAAALSPEAAVPWLAGFKRRVEIGAVNSPRSITISGEPAALDELARKLEASGIWCRFLRVHYAFHSAQMDPVKKTLKAALRGILSRTPAIPLCSTVTGKISSQEKFGAEYWWQNVRQPVRFAEGIQALVEAGFTTFVEIGPHPALSGSVSECLKAGGIEGLTTHSLRRGEAEETTLLGALGALHGQGVSFHRPARGRHVRLPLHPWKHERYWHEAAESVATRFGPPGHPLLGRALNTAEPLWESPLTTKRLPYLADHRLNGRGVFPAAAYVEMALAAGHELFPDGPPVLEDIDFLRALFLPDSDRIARLEFRSHKTDGTFQINAQAGASRAWTTHCTGRIRAGSAARPEAVSLREIQSRCAEERSGATSYELFEKNGFQFGDSFRGMARVWRRDGEALGEICPPPGLKTGGYFLHPALLDSCFQVLLSALPPAESARGLFLPAHLGRMRLLARPAGNIWSHVRLVGIEGRTITADLRLLDDSGGVLAEIKSFRCSALDQPAAKANDLDECFYEIAWREREREATPPAVASCSWLLVGGESALCHAVAARLESCAFAEDVSGIDDRLTGNIGHVVYFASSSDDAGSASILCAGLLALVQKLAAGGSGARLTVVTRSAQPVETTISPAQGALLGLARVVINEHQEMNCRVIDLGAAESDAETAGLVSELLHGGEEEIALRGARRLVPRLVRVAPKPRTSRGDASPFRLEIVKPGALDQVEFRSMKRQPPEAGEVEIEVQAAGLNFRDVMKVLGIYPIEEPADHLLGDECSGRVVAVGAGVGHVSEGDEVLAIFPGSFAKYVTVPSVFVVRKPAHLSFEDAATIPVTFLTAQYALHHLARLERGERVLIHAAAGGVGLAALQIARLAGAEIFATAGSDEKRALVRSLGAAHVMDSRSLEFADEVMEITGGRGVDVVLNSLAGEALTKSVGVLAPYGRFLEIGKRDIYQNSRLGLRPFSRNLSFFAIDLSRLLRDRPAFIGQTLADLMGQFAARELTPLPKKVYPVTQAADAFREMASGHHTGKIVFSLADAAAVPVQPAPDEKVRFRGEASYLITGGVGGFGRTVAEWMIAHGARNLVLIGSRETSAASARKYFENAESQGVKILARAVDVSDATALDRLFSEIRATLPALAGVIHGAMKIDDGVLQQLNPERFRTVMAPKAEGAWNLHVLTRDLPLDFFVMFSSVASVVGNPGQGNYAAANAFLDALASYRRASGLPAQTVNWGHLGGVGYVSRNAHVSEYLNRHGIPELAPPEALELLGRVLQSDIPRVSAMRMDWKQWAEANPRLKQSARYSDLVSLELSAEPREDLAGAIAAIWKASGAGRQKLLETYIQEAAARVLRLPAATLSVTQPLSDFGLDSLMSIELINRIEEGLAQRFPVEKIRGGPSIAMLAKILAGALPAQRPV